MRELFWRCLAIVVVFVLFYSWFAPMLIFSGKTGNIFLGCLFLIAAPVISYYIAKPIIRIVRKNDDDYDDERFDSTAYST